MGSGRTPGAEKGSLLNETPTAVGMMAVIIVAGGSLDSSVRDAAENGPPAVAAILRDVVADADSRTCPDMKEGLSRALAGLPAAAKPFVRAVHMLMAAADSADPAERSGMAAEANAIALAGLKEAGDAYGSGMSNPCMAVFGLGVMVPMVLMSVLPMLSMGGMFGRMPLDPAAISAITLAVIPAAVAAVILYLRSRNPFAGSAERDDPRCVLPLTAALPVFGVLMAVTGDAYASAVAAVSAAGISAVLLSAAGMKEGAARRSRESALKDCLFELGNRLVAGENYETAAVAAVASRKECGPMAESLYTEMVLSRGDCCGAVRSSLGGCSPRMAELFCSVQRSSGKDTRDAGRLAMALGRQMQDEESVRKGIENKLRSMLDMMVGTAALFAPLVLGMSVAMLGPVSALAGSVDPAGTKAVLALYLVELCALISVLTVCLTGREGLRHVVFRFGATAPVALAVFTLCSAWQL